MVSRRGLGRSGRPYFIGARSRRGEDGYNLIVLVVMITVFNILVTKALPLWSAVIKREKEEELIFRGMQYAEAIRVYEKRTGGLPTKLEQLIELEPRCIRQLWKNPLAEDGSWQLIPVGQGQRVGGPNQNPNQNQGRNQDQGRTPLPGDPSRPDPSLLWIPGGENKIGIVPIMGVKSSVSGEAIKTFVTNPSAPGGGGSTEISEWEFTVELARALIATPDPAKPVLPSMNVAQRFKPWPPNVRPINIPTGARANRGGQGGGASAIINPGQSNPSGRGGSG